MSKAPLWDDVLTAACRLQQIIPRAVAKEVRKGEEDDRSYDQIRRLTGIFSWRAKR